MTVEIKEAGTCGDGHVVQFYADEAQLYRTVGSRLGRGCRAGEVSIVIATEPHRRGFAAELQASGCDPVALGRDGALVWLDAAATMARFIHDGEIDPPAFDRVVGTVVRKAAESGRPARAYGEMVALLWDAGHVVGALELEELWNELGREVRFSLLCAYPTASVSGDEHADALRRVCELHTAVLPSGNGEARAAADDPSAAIEVSARFEAASGAPREARRFLTETLRRWGSQRTLLEDAELVLSELATNAVVHARSPFSVSVRRYGLGLRVSVRDGSRVGPTVRQNGPTAISGRGLHLVSALACGWGVDAAPDGKTVWAEFRL